MADTSEFPPFCKKEKMVIVFCHNDVWWLVWHYQRVMHIGCLSSSTLVDSFDDHCVLGWKFAVNRIGHLIVLQHCSFDLWWVS